MLADIHFHLVYGVDDGARTKDAAMKLLRQACAQGVERIVCTSHDYPGVRQLDQERYLKNLRRLRKAASEEGLRVQLLSGSEVMYSPETVELLDAGMVLPFAGGNRVLVEFYPDMPWQLMKKAIGDLKKAGYGVILAHAERYESLRKTDRIIELKKRFGTVIQLNATTVIESKRFFRGRWARKVLKYRLVDVVASDAHNPGKRACRMREAYTLLRAKYGKDYSRQLCCRMPNKLIDG